MREEQRIILVKRVGNNDWEIVADEEGGEWDWLNALVRGEYLGETMADIIDELSALSVKAKFIVWEDN